MKRNACLASLALLLASLIYVPMWVTGQLPLTGAGRSAPGEWTPASLGSDLLLWVDCTDTDKLISTGARSLTASDKAYFSLANSIALSTDDCWWAGWLKCDTTTATQYLFYAGSGVANDMAAAVMSDNTIDFELDTGSEKDTVSTAASVVDGSWHHFCCTADRDDVITVYIDGVPGATADCSGGAAETPTMTTPCIGAKSGGTGCFDGDLSMFLYGQGSLPTGAEINEMCSRPLRYNDLSTALKAKVTSAWDMAEAGTADQGITDRKSANAGSFAAEELLTDQSIENWTGNVPDDWDETENGTSVINDDTDGGDVQDGSHSAELAYDENGSGLKLAETGLLTANHEYTVTGYVKVDSVVSGLGLRIYFGNSDYKSYNIASADFTQFSKTDTPTTGDKVQIQSMNPDADFANRTVHFDNISAKATTIPACNGPDVALLVDSTDSPVLWDMVILDDKPYDMDCVGWRSRQRMVLRTEWAVFTGCGEYSWENPGSPSEPQSHWDQQGYYTALTTGGTCAADNYNDGVTTHVVMDIERWGTGNESNWTNTYRDYQLTTNSDWATSLSANGLQFSNYNMDAQNTATLLDIYNGGLSQEEYESFQTLHDTVSAVQAYTDFTCGHFYHRDNWGSSGAVPGGDGWFAQANFHAAELKRICASDKMHYALLHLRETATGSVVTNGDFDADTDWSKGDAAITISGGTASWSGAQAGNADLTQTESYTETQVYEVRFTVSGMSTGTITPIIAGTSGTGRTANGTYREDVTAGAGSNTVFRGDADFDGSIDDVYVSPRYITTARQADMLKALNGLLDGIALWYPGGVATHTDTWDPTHPPIQAALDLTRPKPAQLGSSTNPIKRWSSDVPSAYSTGLSLLFDASESDSATITDNSVMDLGQSDFCYSFWVKRTSAGQEAIFGKVEDANNFVICEFDASNKIHFYGDEGGGADEIDIQGTTAVTADGSWHHVAIRGDRDSTANTEIWLDGSDDTDGTPTIDTTEFDINADFIWGYDGSNYLDARLDEMRIYGDAPTDAELEDLYNDDANAPTDYLIRYSCDEAMSNTPVNGDLICTVEDSTSNRYQFFQTDFAAMPVMATAGLTFDGTDDYLQHDTASLAGASGGVYAAASTADNTNTYQALLASCDEASATRFCVALLIGSTANKMGFLQRDNDTTGAWYGDSSIGDDTMRVLSWHSSGTAYTATVDESAESLTIENTPPGNDGDWWDDASAKDNLTLGARVISSVGYYLEGTIAEVFATNVLTAAKKSASLTYLAEEHQ